MQKGLLSTPPKQWRIEIDALLDRLHNEPDPPIHALRDEARRILESNRYMYKLTLPSKFVCVHPRNRFGDQVSPGRVHELFATIFAAEWSDEELDVPYAGELPPTDDPEYAEWVNINNRIMEEANGLLPKYEPGMMRLASTTCSHTSQTHRIIDAGVLSTHRCAEDGRLSLEVLAKHRPAYAAAVRTGLAWNVVVYDPVQKECPTVMDLFQEAGNLGHTAVAAESREQIMYKMLMAAKRISENSEGKNLTPDEIWDRVLKEAGRGRPVFASELPGLLKFVRNLSGGISDPVHLNYYRAFLRTIETRVRIVRGVVYESVALAVMGQQNACTKFRIAVCMAMASASADNTINGNEQNLVSSTTDITKLCGSTTLPHVLAAEEMMEQGLVVAAAHRATGAAAATMAEYLFRVRLVHHVMRKPDASRGTYKTVGAIGHAYLEQLSSILNKPVSGPAGWKPDAGIKKVDATPSTTSALAVEFDASGTVMNQIDLLAARGFKTGATIKRQGQLNEVMYTISAVTTSVCKLKDPAGDETTVFHNALDKYRVATPPKSAVYMDDFAKYGPKHCMEWKVDLFFSRVKLALDDVHEDIGTIDGIKLLMSDGGPTGRPKGIVATRRFDRGELKLVPVTSSMVLRKVHDSSVGVETNITITDSKMSIIKKVCLMKKEVAAQTQQDAGVCGHAVKDVPDPFLAAFWSLFPAKLDADVDEEDINMHLQQYTARVHKLQVPLLTNKRVIQAGDALLWAVPPATKPVLSTPHSAKAAAAKPASKVKSVAKASPPLKKAKR